MTIGVAVLGSTGSIGTSTLRVLARLRHRFRVVAITAYGSGNLLEEQAAAVGAEFVGLVNGPAGAQGCGGTDCLVTAATRPDVDIVVNAIVGSAGLEATIAALAARKRVALANKETLVMAGELVLRTAREHGGELIPIDSEHSAVLQCIAGRPAVEVKRLILTASGGPFREWHRDRLKTARVEDALRHPTWQMGRKISVDSATMANKALEVIEAHHLFGLAYEQIDVVVHPQSIIHAFTEFVDGSVLAQVGFPDMELPILYALTYPERVPDDAVKPFDPIAAGPLTFEAVRHDDFPTFSLGVEAGRTGGTHPAVFNAANEVAVEAFLGGRIEFGRIPEVIETVLAEHTSGPAADVAAILQADRWAREATEATC
ncbi:MAG: 1-deoxy-D-xylulose-5-phosphate reductoisomerase [Gemmatimonadota bacterium]|nr:MAG: 1-deoxy-D-xylulose-5-phosphate reductoisomerase [Gemmatimonadota bacterium]